MPSSLRAQLARVPDARRSRLPLFAPAYLPYAALMIGAAPAAMIALWNSAGLRRFRPALLAVALGALSWISFGIVAQAIVAAGLTNLALVMIVARLANLGFGLLLARTQWAYVRGHQFLHGRTVPLLPAVLVTMGLALLLPWKALLALWGLWQLLL